MLDLTPYHEAFDSPKLAALVESMRSSGWQGAPLVQYGGALLNGSHRWEAARVVARDDYMFEPIVVDFCDEFPGIDEEEIEDLVSSLDNWQLELTRLAWESDSEKAEYLGLDIH